MKSSILFLLTIILLSPLTSQSDSSVGDITIEQLRDGSGLAIVCYTAYNDSDSVLSINSHAKSRDSLDWHIPVITLFDTIAGYHAPNYGWKVSASDTGERHCFVWDMTIDLGRAEDCGFMMRVATFDSLVSRFNIIDSFQVGDTLLPNVRAFGLCYKDRQLWVMFHHEITHDCWIRPYRLPEMTPGDSIYIGSVTVGPSDMAFAGDRLFWTEDTRMLLKEFDFERGVSDVVRSDWWGLPGTFEHAAGAAFDGRNLWVCFARGTFVALDTSDFSLVDTMFFPEFAASIPATAADGLAWGLGLLWCYSNDNIVYSIDIATKSIIHRIPTGEVVEMTGAEGAAWDGTHLWVVDYSRKHCYKLLLYGQIKFYASDSFCVDNIPPRLDWITPACPDYADSFPPSDTVEIAWGLEEMNRVGGITRVFLGPDTLFESDPVESSFPWQVPNWHGFRGQFTVECRDGYGNDASLTSCLFYIRIPDGIGDVALPGKSELSVFPNPFNSSVRISISPPYQGGDVRRTEGVQIEIFDIAGRKVANLGEATVGAACMPPVTQNTNSVALGKTGRIYASPAPREFLWRPDETIGSGVYLVRARFDEKTSATRRIVYLK